MGRTSSTYHRHHPERIPDEVIQKWHHFEAAKPANFRRLAETADNKAEETHQFPEQQTLELSQGKDVIVISQKEEPKGGLNVSGDLNPGPSQTSPNAAKLNALSYIMLFITVLMYLSC